MYQNISNNTQPEWGLKNIAQKQTDYVDNGGNIGCINYFPASQSFKESLMYASDHTVNTQHKNVCFGHWLT